MWLEDAALPEEVLGGSLDLDEAIHPAAMQEIGVFQDGHDREQALDARCFRIRTPGFRISQSGQGRVHQGGETCGGLAPGSAGTIAHHDAAAMAGGKGRMGGFNV